MIDKNLIEEKIRNIQEYITEVEPILSLRTREIMGNVEKLRTLERNFQLIVDEMLDVNIYFIKEMNLESPDDFQNTFETVGTHGILPSDFAYKIAPAVGLRNRIVHRYETIDRKLFIDTFKKDYSDFEKYTKYIEDYLARHE